MRESLVVSCSLVFATLSSLACASAPVHDKPAGTLTSSAYYPLAVGNRWTYRLSPAPPDMPPQEVKILERDGAGFFVDSQGGKLAPRTDGIFDGQQGRYLLQDPLVVGHEWIAVPSATQVERIRVAATDAAVQVPAGSFSDCVVVEAKEAATNPHTGQAGTLTLSFSYAPGVGLVQVLQRFQPEGGEAVVVGRVELVSYDVKPTE